ncbi:flavin reductase family protein [Nocardioides bruguierae]|uniref:flavin reductase family protein n=1 Tax=Nocardioides bruguierae TaxID=2945102 RepID=UPI00202066E8|nr:flavin reductase family protein [Nocardioides bruguierae]MCL8025379.1 flavin reductase family protein [Nocardioides bruguierae]
MPVDRRAHHTPAPDARALRNAFGRFATGVTVVTCAAPDPTTGEPGRHGATVTAFMPVSLDPPLLQVALTRTSRACGLLEGAAFAVNVLAADQVDVAMHFAGRPSPGPLPWDAATLEQDGRRTVVPTLGGTAATFVCRPWRSVDGGDHVLHLGEVVRAETSARASLLFADSAFREVGARHGDVVWLGCADDPQRGWFDAACDFSPPVVRRPEQALAHATHY